MQMITFQRKRANRRIQNEADLLKLLRKYGPVQIVEFNSSHSVRDQIATISQTGVFVSVRLCAACRTACVLVQRLQHATHCASRVCHL